jgi:hypothetical protein
MDGSDNTPILSGPSVLLWVLYNNNLTAMVEDKDIAFRAAEIEQRLNLKTDPASSAGATYLVVDSSRTKINSKDLSQASGK